MSSMASAAATGRINAVGTGARALLEIIELPHEVARRAAGKCWNLSEPLQPRPVTRGALRRGVSHAFCRKRFAFLHAADRHISDKAQSRIAVFELHEIFGHFDYAVADRLRLAGLRIGQK
jgi:hypothetical protein